MKNKLKFIFLIGLVLLIFGCTQTTPETNTSDELDPALKGIIAREVARESGVSEQGARDFLDTVSDPAVQRQIEESSRELEERQTGNANAQERNVSGAMREKLSNGHIELQVNKVEYRTQIDEDGLLKVEEGYDYKFILLNLTVKNLGTQPIAWLTSDFENIYQGYSNTFGLRTSNPRNPVGLLESCASDPKMKNGMDSSALQPGEEKTGWVACEINVENDQVTAIYDDAIPIMERSGPNGPKSYGTITIKIVDALVDDVTAIGKLNEFVGNEYTPVDVKINSFEYKDNLTGVNLPKLCKQTQFRSSPDTACKALIVNATIKNKSGYNLPITYGVKRFTVILDKMIEVTSIYQADPLQGMEDYEGGANEEIEIYDNQSQLQEYYIENYTGHLSLENFEPGEERTGSLVFLVPKNDELFPNDATNIVFRRYFPFDRTQILIPLNENQETIKELEDIKTHYTP